MDSDKKKGLTPVGIVSYGVILFSVKDSSCLQFLIYQRRDSFEYMDFLRGLWNTESSAIKLLSNMSHEERNRLENYTFDELWSDLWINALKNGIYSNGYGKAYNKYQTIKRKLPKLLKDTTTMIDSPPWEFPKGKKNSPGENSVKCAIREFEEETNIKISGKAKLARNEFFIENFKGSNGKYYTTRYYLFEIPEISLPEPIKTPECIRKFTISEEASDVRWVCFDEAKTLLDKNKVKILQEAIQYIG